MMSSTRSSAGITAAVFLAIGSMMACTRTEAPAPAATVAPKLPAIDLKEQPGFPLKAHLESADLAGNKVAFKKVFEDGSGLFHAVYNGLDGVGVAVRPPKGDRIFRFAPMGAGGPAAQSCGECHAVPFPSSAGLAHSSIARDPDNDGKPPFNVRSMRSLFGNGTMQLLAQEMTEELQAARDDAAKAASGAPGTTVWRDLKSKGTSFGAIGAIAGAKGVTFDTSKVQGLDPDLVVRPFGWKGDTPTLRIFSAAVSTFGLGMEAEEVVWKLPGGDKNTDLDADGVARELSVGDVTAMTVYNAALETPSEVARLAALGYVQTPTNDDTAQIAKGLAAFGSIGCATCHTPEMHLANTKFEEPTARGNGHYYDHPLAAKDPNYDPKRPVSFDVLTDAQAPRVEAAASGGATVRPFGDLKRHAMGRALADPGGPSETDTSDLDSLKIDGKPVKIPADQFLTAALWGVGNTGPYLHDNRAGTLREAVLLHGEDKPPAPGQPGRSEAQEARDAFKALPSGDQQALIAFLRSLQTFSPPKK